MNRRIEIWGSLAMEMYFTPLPGATTSREAFLDSFASAGLKPAAETSGQFWLVSFAGLETFLNCQESNGQLSFVTLEFPSSELAASHSVFSKLEDIGWEASEDVG